MQTNHIQTKLCGDKAAANMGIGGNGGQTSIFQLKNKSRQRSGVDLILGQNPVTSNFLILKASAAGQTNKASLPLRQCSNVSWQLLLYSATRIKLQRQIIGQHFSGSFQIVGDKQYLIRGVT